MTLFIMHNIVFSQNNYAMSFDGIDDYVLIDPDLNLFDTDFSLSIWVKLENFDPCGYYTFIGDNQSWFGANNQMIYFGYNGQSYDACPTGSCVGIDFYEPTPGYIGMYTGQSYATNCWTNWTATYNSNTLERKIYRDGILITDSILTNGYSPTVNGCDLILGAHFNTQVNNFSGLMDNVSIWSKLLTDEEVLYYQSADITGNEDGLELYYNFENQGVLFNQISDVSSSDNTNAYNGTIFGATYIEYTPNQNDEECLDQIIGGCLEEGCMDEEACNYNPNSVEEYNSLCEYLDTCGYCPDNEIIGEYIPGFYSPQYYNGKYYYVSIWSGGDYANLNYEQAVSVTNNLGGQLANLTEEELPFLCEMENICCTGSAYFINNYQALNNPSNDDCAIINWPGTSSVDLNGNHQFIMEINACPILGCTDEAACNYNENANEDDNSCTYPTSSETTITTCGPYTWNDVIYNNTGVYYYDTIINDYSIPFNGVRAVEANPNFSFNSDLGLTITMWVKNDWTIYNPNSYGLNECLFSFECDGDELNGIENYVIGAGLDDNGILCHYSNGDACSYNIANQSELDNEWIHLAFTYTVNSRAFYINGEEVSNDNSDDTSFSSIIKSPGNKFMIGQRFTGAYYYGGLMDDFKLYGKELSPQEIIDDMNCMNNAELIAYFDFNEGDGSTVYDQVNNVNGNFINSSEFTNDTQTNCTPDLLNSDGCDSIAVLNLTINPLEIDLGDDITTCEEWITLDAGEGYSSYLWLPNGETTQSITVNQSGTYSVEILEFNGLNCDEEGDYEEIEGFEYLGSFSNSHYYSSNTPSSSWFDAYNQSILFGGNLVTFSSLAEFEYITNLTTEQHWIGLVDEGYFTSNGDSTLVNNNIIWVDETNYDINNLPNMWPSSSSVCGNDEYCGQINGSIINDLCCWYDWQSFILEINCEPECSTTDQINVTFNSQGCTDALACNYNPDAICENNSCEYISPIDLGENIITCEESIILDAGEGYDSYSWSTGEISQSIIITESGEYSLEVNSGQINQNSVKINTPSVLESGGNETINNLFSSNNPFSVSFWVKSENFSTTQLCDKGYSDINGDNNASSMQLFIDQNTLSFQLYQDSNNSISITTEADQIPITNEWNHIACTYDGGNDPSSMNIFINGDMIATNNNIEYGNFEGMNYNNEPMHFGARIDPAGYSSFELDGYYDNIAIYDYNLTSMQVLSIYECISNIDPLFLWDFEGTDFVVDELIWGTFFSNNGSGPGLYTPGMAGGNNQINLSIDIPYENCVECSDSDAINVEFGLQGCTDNTAVNYDMNAICDDGSCIYCGSLQVLDYGDYLDADDIYFDNTDGLTISLWVHDDNFYQNPEDFATYIDFGSQDSYRYVVRNRGGKIEAFFEGEDLQTNFNNNNVEWEYPYTAVSAGLIDTDCGSNTDGWHNVTAVYCATGIRIYIDGLIGSQGVTYVYFDQLFALTQESVKRIGNNQLVEEPADANIDEVRIWNRALSSEEVLERASINLNTSEEQGLIGYWKFDGSYSNEITLLNGSGNGVELTTTQYCTDECDISEYIYECSEDLAGNQDCNSCVPTEGCMDDGNQIWSPYPGFAACNYDPLAVINIIENCFYVQDDCLVEYPEYYDCECKCINDIDGDDICDEIDCSPTVYNPDQDCSNLDYDITFKKLIKTTDVLGREIDINTHNTLIFERYDDGSIEKRCFLK